MGNSINHMQHCQNVPAIGNFATFSPFLAAYSTLDFTMSPLSGKGAWCLLPTTPSMLSTATKHFDRAVHAVYQSTWYEHKKSAKLFAVITILF